MSCFKIKFCVASTFALALGLFIAAGYAAPKTTPSTVTAPKAAAPLAPGTNDGRIAYVTARLLEEYHYSQHPLDQEMSEKFFDGYLDTLDPQHIYFLKSDLAEFAHYRTNLNTLTINNHGAANLTPAYQIFERFLERLNQRVACVDKLLKHDKFKLDA